MTRRWKQPEQRRNLPSSYRQDIEHFNFTLNSDESQIPGLRGCRVRRFTCFSNVVFACWIRSSDRKRSVPLLHNYKTKSHFMLSTTFFYLQSWASVNIFSVHQRQPVNWYLRVKRHCNTLIYDILIAQRRYALKTTRPQFVDERIY